MLTISRLSRWSINYYNDTANQARQAAMDATRANGGLGEYYSEGDTRAPIWMVTGDRTHVSEATGLSVGAVEGGFADTEQVAQWLDNGIAPSGASGRGFGKDSVHGFDLTFAAPKSVSLFRALSDEVGDKVMGEAHNKAVAAALTYLHQHAGYTRVHNPVHNTKDLQRLPGLVAVGYQHETSRCGDPHLHTHVIVPNRQPRADGELVSIDSKSLFHEAKAAGIIYQAVLRHELHAERGFEFHAVDEHSGMAEIAGVTKDCIKAWSQRSTRLREWAADNLVLVDGEPTAAQLEAAQKATRQAKPESLAWTELKTQWRDDTRGLQLERGEHFAARDRRRGEQRQGLDRPRLREMVAKIDKPTFTRADLVELVGAQMPIDIAGDPRELVEQIVDTVCVRVSDPRQAHHREGHEKFTLDVVIAEEERIFGMVDERDDHAKVFVYPEHIGDLSADQARAISNIATSPQLVQPLQAPAGAGKTHSMKALRAAAHRAGKEIVVLAPTGKAVDAALQEEAGDRGLTVAKALRLIEVRELDFDRNSIIVVDEASMLGTPDLKKLLSCAVEARAKIVLVGDAYQLDPVAQRGGMFEQLCEELPWSQRLSEVWRIRNKAERDASLALRSAHGNRLRQAVGWYRNHDRLHTGDPVAMAQDAYDAYLADRDAGKEALLICQTWEMADNLNKKLHHTLTDDGPSVTAARDQQIRVGDIIMSRNNDVTIPVAAGPNTPARRSIDQVRNGNRWRVVAVDADHHRIYAERSAERDADGARAVFDGDYLRHHITLGYAATVHSAQGVTADTTHSVVGETANRAMAYVALTRGRHANHVYIYQEITGEADHEHAPTVSGDQIHHLRRGNKHAATHYFKQILDNDERPRTAHAESERAQPDTRLPIVTALLDRHEQRRAARRANWRTTTRATYAREAAVDDAARDYEQSQSVGDHQQSLGDDTGLEL